MAIQPYAPWLPDLPKIENPGSTIATNVIPAQIGYKPFQKLVAQTSFGALDSRIQGSITAVTPDGVATIFAGTSAKLWRIVGNSSWSDVSQAVYITPNEYNWSFTKFGNQVIATNYNDDIQVFDIASGGGTFTTLLGSPPRARYVTTIRDFVVIANVDTSGTAMPTRVKWSAINNPESWSDSAATQSDFQEIPGNGGHITGIVGGEYGVVFLEQEIWKMTYVGSPIIFQFDLIDQNRGTRYPHSIIRVGTNIFFYNDDGFYMCNGSQSAPIGANKVDKFFVDDFDKETFHLMSTAFDPFNKVVIWLYRSIGYANMDRCDKALLYNWEQDKWSLVDGSPDANGINIQFIASSLRLGYTIDTLDQVTTDLDALPASLDSPIWNSGAYRLAAFNASNQLGYFEGGNMQATIETAEYELNPNRRSFVKSVKPIIEGSASYTCTIGYKDFPTSVVSYTSAMAIETRTGECSFRVNARYQRARTTIAESETWTIAQGIEVIEQNAAGRR